MPVFKAKSKDHQYAPLLTDTDASSAELGSPSIEKHSADHDDDAVLRASSNFKVISRRLYRALYVVIVVESLLVAFLLGFIVSRPVVPAVKSAHDTEDSIRWDHANNQDHAVNLFPQLLYSPAQEALENVHKVWGMGLGASKTIYQGEPSPEVDQAWEALYNVHGLSKIPKWQARLLPNKTLPIPGHEDYYAVGLSVFHQLHCLNLIRKGFAADYYRDPVTGNIADIRPEDWEGHVSHCIDNIRQAITCASDISLIVWQWVDEANQAAVTMNTVHSCRNFDRIVDWAKANRRTEHFDLSIHVQDDIEIPLIH